VKLKVVELLYQNSVILVEIGVVNDRGITSEVAEVTK
jgi:hypothetical protein